MARSITGAYRTWWALRYTEEDVVAWAQEAGFVANRCVVEPVEDMPMNAVYLEGTKDLRPKPLEDK